MRSFSSRSAFVAAFVPVTWLVALALASPGAEAGGVDPRGPAVAATTVLLGALVVRRRRRLGTVLAATGWFGALALGAPTLLTRPTLTLALLVGVSALVFIVWRWRSTAAPIGPALGTAPPPPTLVGPGSARFAFVASVLCCLLAAVAPIDHHALALAGAGASLAYAAVLWAVAFAQAPRSLVDKVALGIGGVLALGVVALAAASQLGSALALGAVLAVFGAVYPLRDGGDDDGGTPLWVEVIAHHPARLLVVTFALLCAGGAVLLWLPLSSTAEGGISFIDAAFTSTSAVCVTGLIVLDTPTAFTGYGQGVLLLLIQVGGLGIMTFSTAAFAMLGRRLTLSHERAVAELLGGDDRTRLVDVLRQTLRVTFGLEAVGALWLAACFWLSGDTLLMAVWRGVFTSISAFCNAGFALQSASLIPYQHSGAVLHAVAALIVAGGLSPAAIVALPQLTRGRRLTLRMKMVFSMTATLLVGGFVLLLALEWNVSLAGMSLADKLNNAWFQSATLRTAGFNSVGMQALSPASITLMIFLMFIGGSPGGTAGGIKTTTAFVVFMPIVTAIRGRQEVTAFGREIPRETVYRAAAIAVLGMLTVAFALVALQVTQAIPMDVALFEVVSAIGTVGLTIGATPKLDFVGKVIIMLCMFLGRVGPLTAFLLLSEQHSESSWHLPEEAVPVG